ncbi:MAG: aspartyl protease [Crocosphaera sp.]
MNGHFGENGELLFDVELIAVNQETVSVEVLLDTGFTTGWLGINRQDAEALGWPIMAAQIEMQTASGNDFFSLCEGKIRIDEQIFNIPVHVGVNFSEILLGCQWLEMMELVVNKPQNLLTLTLLE